MLAFNVMKFKSNEILEQGLNLQHWRCSQVQVNSYFLTVAPFIQLLLFTVMLFDPTLNRLGLLEPQHLLGSVRCRYRGLFVMLE